MKIKEKGLTGKAANNKRDLIAGPPRKFDAFRLMNKAGNSGATDGAAEPKKDIYLEYFGAKMLIVPDSNGQGCVSESEVPFVKNATLKYEGSGENVQWGDIKVRFSTLRSSQSQTFISRPSV